MPTTADEPELVLSEAMQVWWNRYEEARLFGFTLPQARAYAGSEIDCGELRHLKEMGCSAEMAAEILL